VSNKPHISKFVGAMGLILVAFCISGSTTNPADVYLPQLRDKDTEPDRGVAGAADIARSRMPKQCFRFFRMRKFDSTTGRARGSQPMVANSERESGKYVNALEHNLRSEVDFEDEKNHGRARDGLLTRRYDSKMFSRSQNGRWVIYERRVFRVDRHDNLH